MGKSLGGKLYRDVPEYLRLKQQDDMTRKCDDEDDSTISASIFRVLGYQFDPFRGDALEWNVYLVIRVAVLICINVFLPNHPEAQGCLALFLTIAYLYLNQVYEPFNTSRMNSFDRFFTVLEAIFIMFGFLFTAY